MEKPVTIKALEEETFYKDDTNETPPSDIIAYNELRSCADLFRMYTHDILEIQPSFQREIVWNGPSQTRFIDSLIKQLPIPSMCFSLDFSVQKWQVIDGLQRMSTIIRFLSGDEWKLSRLDDINPDIAGKNVQEIRNPQSPLYRYFQIVENLTLPITVIRCDYSKKNHSEYLFTIFHRLNSGGMRLNNQEIRNCIYSGPLNDLIKELNKENAWMKINKMRKTNGARFRNEEKILRFFAFSDKYSLYNGKLAGFLNDYMHTNRNISLEDQESKRLLFMRTINIVYQKLFQGRIPAKLSNTVLEALLVGVSLNITSLENKTSEDLKELFLNMVDHEEFSEEKLREGLSGKVRVLNRLDVAREIFSE